MPKKKARKSKAQSDEEDVKVRCVIELKALVLSMSAQQETSSVKNSQEGGGREGEKESRGCG